MGYSLHLFGGAVELTPSYLLQDSAYLESSFEETEMEIETETVTAQPQI